MSNPRVTWSGVEIFYTPQSKARVTWSGVEVFYFPSSGVTPYEHRHHQQPQKKATAKGRARRRLGVTDPGDLIISMNW